MYDDTKKFCTLHSRYGGGIYFNLAVSEVHFFFREGWKIIYFVLSGWRVNLLAENQDETCLSSLLTVLVRVVISLWLKKMLVSSANSKKCRSLEELNRSFMYIRKSFIMTHFQRSGAKINNNGSEAEKTVATKRANECVTLMQKL